MHGLHIIMYIMHHSTYSLDTWIGCNVEGTVQLSMTQVYSDCSFKIKVHLQLRDDFKHVHNMPLICTSTAVEFLHYSP